MQLPVACQRARPASRAPCQRRALPHQHQEGGWRPASRRAARAQPRRRRRPAGSTSTGTCSGRRGTCRCSARAWAPARRCWPWPRASARSRSLASSSRTTAARCSPRAWCAARRDALRRPVPARAPARLPCANMRLPALAACTHLPPLASSSPVARAGRRGHARGSHSTRRARGLRGPAGALQPARERAPALRRPQVLYALTAGVAGRVSYPAYPTLTPRRAPGAVRADGGRGRVRVGGEL